MKNDIILTSEKQPVFVRGDEIRNSIAVQRIIDNAVYLKQGYSECGITMLNDPECAFLHLCDCISRMAELEREIRPYKNDAFQITRDAAKTVDEVIYTLDHTVTRDLKNKELSVFIDKFLTDCSFGKRILETGHKLTEEDYGFIDLKKCRIIPVNDAEQNNMILDKLHDSYIIYYDNRFEYEKDTDFVSYRVISGKYTIGKYTPA